MIHARPAFTQLHIPVAGAAAVRQLVSYINELLKDGWLYFQAGESTAAYRREEIPRDTIIVTVSTDYAYYHQFEIAFHEVKQHWMPFNEIWPDAPGEPQLQLQEEDDHFLFIMKNVNTGQQYVVAATGISFYAGTVYYYKRDRLDKNERCAIWI
ncbi:hypothetical protein [Sediminibacterium ginsengisoli]|uniref:Uncharacterized protein n=1 Tax=Sediminibacterium ginsengisoli TaxID=413434 RepID=A0A1T4R2W6_9BACT|nr:hypothetical protein [Sediminibacterium ginsengisoli]SKA09958.1 hypothetical protein SAMN04488132_11069 [Sediminibacterium ginsengisoli]